MSWQNLALYTAATPQYDDEGNGSEGENGYSDATDACSDENIKRNANTEDIEYIR